jgi:hypothetical protein
MSLKGLKFRLVQQFVYMKKGLIWNVSGKSLITRIVTNLLPLVRFAHTGNCAALQFVRALS